MSVFRIHAPPIAGGVSRKADASLVRAALETLVDPASAFELRALRKIPGTTKAIPRYEVFAPGKLAEAVRFCERSNMDGSQVYLNLNPVSPELVGPDRKATDATVLCRRWLMVDVDPLRDAAHKDDSANEAEKEAAREIAVVLLDRLTQQGWPLPILADSGNGFHLLYRIDLPNNDHARLLCRSVLKGLAADTAGLDTKTYNASRICKVPGTWAMKGEESSDRPFRMARILHCPETLEPVPVELLSAWLPTSTPPPAPPPRQETGSTFRVHAVNGVDKSARERLYVRKTFEACISRVILATPGGEGGTGRNDCLFKSAARLGEFIASGHLLRQEVEEALRSAARRVGLYEDSGCGEHGVESTIRSGISHGLTQPWPGLPDDNVSPGAQAQARPEPPDPSEVIILRASSVTPRRVQWLWPGRIPLGKLTTFAGVGGLGKTFVLCDISARVTTGREWPDAPDVPTERGSVLFISGEDDPDDTLVPRLIEAKADLHRVCFLTASAGANFTLAAIGVLTQALGQIGDDTRLVVIDPPTSYLAGVDDHKNAELRGLLSPLAAWAAEKRLAIVFNTHVNKPQGSKVEAMMRVMGSVAWVNAVRAAHMFAKDPEDNSKRIFVGMKSNLGRERKGLAYKIVSDSQDDDGPARVEWLGAVDTTADQAVSQQQQPKRGEVASEWLIERFRECRQWRSDDLFRAARECGISRSAVFDAKRRLELPKARKITRQDGNEDWYWWVPDDWPQLVQSHTGTEPVEPLEPVETEAEF